MMSRRHCARTGPEGYLCCREPGHDGPHAALTDSGDFYGAWDTPGTCTPAPEPIDPADVRVGDRVRVIREGEVTAASEERSVLMIHGAWVRTEGATLYLLDRPDPDAELIRVIEHIDQGLHGAPMGTWGRGFLDALAGAGYLIEPAPRPES